MLKHEVLVSFDWLILGASKVIYPSFLFSALILIGHLFRGGGSVFVRYRSIIVNDSLALHVLALRYCTGLYPYTCFNSCLYLFFTLLSCFRLPLSNFESLGTRRRTVYFYRLRTPEFCYSCICALMSGMGSQGLETFTQMGMGWEMVIITQMGSRWISC